MKVMFIRWVRVADGCGRDLSKLDVEAEEKWKAKNGKSTFVGIMNVFSRFSAILINRYGNFSVKVEMWPDGGARRIQKRLQSVPDSYSISCSAAMVLTTMDTWIFAIFKSNLNVANIIFLFPFSGV